MQLTTPHNILAQPIVGGQEVLSKVIVIEQSGDRQATLKEFFEECRLLGYRVTRENILAILSSNIDLGGVFMPEVDELGGSYIALAMAIHQVRPDLPIFLGIEPGRTLEDLSINAQKAVVGVYLHGDIKRMKELVDTYLFSRHYPNEFISGIKEITGGILQTSFKDMQMYGGR